MDTIRFYEKEGLLRAPGRSEGGFRLYTAREIAQLQFIRKAQELGFSLAEIRELHLIQDERTKACEHVRYLIQNRLQAIRGKIDDLRRLERHMKDALHKCDAMIGDGATHTRCPVLEEIRAVKNGRGKR